MTGLRVEEAGDGAFDGAELAARLAGECADMAEVMQEIQSHLGDFIARSNSGFDTDTIRLLQEIDRITQTLEDLSRLQAGLAVQMDGLRIPRHIVLSPLRLKSLSDRLSLPGS